jgi:hypothetical protein
MSIEHKCIYLLARSLTPAACPHEFLLAVKVMVWGALRLICGARVESAWAVDFYLRPHHLADDFCGLMTSARRAWEKVSSLHACSLCRAVPAIVVDGKWCMQVSLCNYRPCGAVWNQALATGSVVGCTNRPQRGSKYCAQHNLPRDCEAVDVLELVCHREVVSDTSVCLEYKSKDGSWIAASAVSAESIRAYEMQLLPTFATQHANEEPETCSKDPRRGTVESYASRKSGGLLVAVYPCMHIVGVRPMYSSESLTQVILFVWHVLSYLRTVEWVIYDFACGILRHIRVQMRKRQGTASHAAWGKLMALKWVIDRLHFGKGHTACKDEKSTYFEPSVNPYACDELVGIDTEAAEQIFHVANRWQANLSNSHPVHFELQLLLLSNEHNERNRCDIAYKVYLEKQAAGETQRCVVAKAVGEKEEGPCSEGVVRKRRKLPSKGCGEPSGDDAVNREAQPAMRELSAGTSSSASADAPPASMDSVGRDFLACEHVCVNLGHGSKTVHKVMAYGRVWIHTKCSYVPAWGTKPVPLQSLTGVGLYTCGTCCGSRRLLLLE